MTTTNLSQVINLFPFVLPEGLGWALGRVLLGPDRCAKA